MLELLDDIAELRPTIFCSVPRLWNRIHDRVMAQVNSSNLVSRSLFKLAYESKLAALRRGDLKGGRFGPMWDRLVFSKIRARLGGTAAVSPCSCFTLAIVRTALSATSLGNGPSENVRHGSILCVSLAYSCRIAVNLVEVSVSLAQARCAI